LVPKGGVGGRWGGTPWLGLAAWVRPSLGLWLRMPRRGLGQAVGGFWGPGAACPPCLAASKGPQPHAPQLGFAWNLTSVLIEPSRPRSSGGTISFGALPGPLCQWTCAEHAMLDCISHRRPMGTLSTPLQSPCRGPSSHAPESRFGPGARARRQVQSWPGGEGTAIARP
jgi:hypothetical protein